MWQPRSLTSLRGGALLPFSCQGESRAEGQAPHDSADITDGEEDVVGSKEGQEVQGDQGLSWHRPTQTHDSPHSC